MALLVHKICILQLLQEYLLLLPLVPLSHCMELNYSHKFSKDETNLSSLFYINSRYVHNESSGWHFTNVGRPSRADTTDFVQSLQGSIREENWRMGRKAEDHVGSNRGVDGCSKVSRDISSVKYMAQSMILEYTPGLIRKVMYTYLRFNFCIHKLIGLVTFYLSCVCLVTRS